MMIFFSKYQVMNEMNGMKAASPFDQLLKAEPHVAQRKAKEMVNGTFTVSSRYVCSLGNSSGYIECSGPTSKNSK